jgi:hypothetical protein
MVDPDIRKAIEIIDQKILSLQQARNQLAQAFGLEQSPHDKASAITIAAASIPFPGIPGKHLVADQRKPRKEALAEFLITHGPMSRVEIVAKSGLPEGSISYCLSDSRFFEQSKDGNWGATEFSRHGFELKSQRSNPTDSA